MFNLYFAIIIVKTLGVYTWISFVFEKKQIQNNSQIDIMLWVTWILRNERLNQTSKFKYKVLTNQSHTT